MTRKRKGVEIINPPNLLKAKVGGKLAPLDEAAIARAEAALHTMSGEFQDWIEDHVDQLVAARWRVETERYAQGAMARLLTCAHDLKGLGVTFKYPLVTRIAASLCTLLEAKSAESPPQLIDAHVDAIRATVRQRMKSDTDPIGLALLHELETLVAEHLGGAGKPQPGESALPDDHEDLSPQAARSI